MDNDQIVSRMNSYLHTSANVLADWLGSLLPRASDDWWEECVLDKLSYNQREMAIERGFTELGQFDLAALLRIADKSWYKSASRLAQTHQLTQVHTKFIIPNVIESS